MDMDIGKVRLVCRCGLNGPAEGDPVGSSQIPCGILVLGPLRARGDMDDKNPQPGHGKPVTVKQTAGEDASVPSPGKAVTAPPLRGEGTGRQKDEEEDEE